MTEQKQTKAISTLTNLAVRLATQEIIQKCQAVGFLKGEHQGEYLADFSYRGERLDIFHDGTGMFRGQDELRVEYDGRTVLDTTEYRDRRILATPNIILIKRGERKPDGWNQVYVTQYHPGKWEKVINEELRSLGDAKKKLAEHGMKYLDTHYDISPKFVESRLLRSLSRKQLERILERFGKLD